jgi:peptide/nickel transport system substrate-binding protein
VNLAADRAAAVEIAGGPDVAAATCQILPPHFPGYVPYCPYTGPGTPTPGGWASRDLERARQLVARSGTKGMAVTVWSWGDLPGLGPFAVQLLDSLRYHATMKSKSGFGYFDVIGDSRTRAQIGTYEWISDYPAASGFFSAVLSCASFHSDDPTNLNPSEFCDTGIDDQSQRAAAVQATNPDQAGVLWADVDRRTVDLAPWVPLVNPESVDVVSKRVGDYQSSPPLGVLFDQLWVH